jgi:hypothetical protein
MQAEAEELVWNFLLKNQDRFSGSSAADSAGDSTLTVVSSLRQEEIALKIGVPLHRVIEAIQQLSSEQRLTVFAQGPGSPNQYILRRTEPIRSDRIAL